MIAAIQLLQRQREILQANIALHEKRMQDANSWHMQNFKDKEIAITQLKQVDDALRTLKPQELRSDGG